MQWRNGEVGRGQRRGPGRGTAGDGGRRRLLGRGGGRDGAGGHGGARLQQSRTNSGQAGRSGRSLVADVEAEGDELDAPLVPATRSRRGTAVGRADDLVAGLGDELVPGRDVHVVKCEEPHDRVLAIDLVEPRLLQVSRYTSPASLGPRDRGKARWPSASQPGSHASKTTASQPPLAIAAGYPLGVTSVTSRYSSSSSAASRYVLPSVTTSTFARRRSGSRAYA